METVTENTKGKKKIARVEAVEVCGVESMTGSCRLPKGHLGSCASPTSPTTNGHAPPLVRALRCTDIDESPTNPRKTFAGVEQLADDLKRRGVLQPVLVRPSPGKMGRFELVFGARRLRASKLAGLLDVPAMVRSLSDEECLEIQIIENSQRVDIHPMEEADGYLALREKYQWSVEDIAAKVGKAVGTVRQRLKLCGLVPKARQAFLADKFNAGVALVLGRIPHPDLQLNALNDIFEWQGDDDSISLSEATRIVRDHYMLVLSEAPFDRSDVTLLPGVADCGSCPKRTGNQRELFADISAKEDLCTDQKCFGKKKDQTWKNKAAAAKAKGATVLSDKEAAPLFDDYGTHQLRGTAFVDLGAKTYDRKTGKPHANRALIGGKAADVPIVLARAPDGSTRELVAAADFKAAAKAAGNGATIAPAFSSHRSPSEIAAEKVRRAKEAKKREAFALELEELVVAAEENERVLDGFWRTLASALARIVWSDTRSDICRRRKIDISGKAHDSDKLLSAHAAGLTGREARGLVVELVVTMGRGNVAEGFKAFREFYELADAKPKKPAKVAKPARRK